MPVYVWTTSCNERLVIFSHKKEFLLYIEGNERLQILAMLANILCNERPFAFE